MKKVLFSLLFAGMCSFYSCGPNAAEKADTDKATQDSINAAQAAAQAIQANTMMDTVKMNIDTSRKK